jgi:hypothetical protein
MDEGLLMEMSGSVKTGCPFFSVEKEDKNGDLDRKTEIKKDLLIELATKADIATLNGKIDSLKHATKADLEK